MVSVAAGVPIEEVWPLIRRVTYYVSEDTWQTMVMTEERFDDEGTLYDLVVNLATSGGELLALRGPPPMTRRSPESQEPWQQLPLI